jgi:hypothetical protein
MAAPMQETRRRAARADAITQHRQLALNAIQPLVLAHSDDAKNDERKNADLKHGGSLERPSV